MSTYVRFQTQLRCPKTTRPAGIFLAAGRVEDDDHLPQTTRDRLQEHLHWFNKNLSVPLLGDRGWRCVFWFRSDAQWMLHRVWDLIAVLEEEGVHVNKVWTRQPGRIVYLDKHQIGAIPQHRLKALRV